MNACCAALQEKYRQLFSRGLEASDQEGRLAKASAWYVTSFGTKNDRKKSLLSFGWIMSELLCEIKQFQKVKNFRYYFAF